ncbi:MAG: tetratricopeptide repeat protein [Bacillota bacterium]|nr:tetratricopeptide repeat protein [Bacillota bacterium]
MAQSTKKQILPVEMEQLDMEEFKKQYADVPDCVEAEDEVAFKQRLLESLCHLALLENEHDPVHTYLIGLAYLNGIDVEVDTERAVELITKAAQAGVLEAIRQLGTMYHEGRGVKLDWQEELFWRKKAYEICKEEYGEETPETLTALNNLTMAYGDLGNYEKALELFREAYEKSCKVWGEEKPDTLIVLNNLAEAYRNVGNYEKSLELQEEAYEKSCKVLGEEKPDTLTSLNNLAMVYGNVGNYEKSLELQKEIYERNCKIFGEEHSNTLASLSNLAVAYGDVGNYEKLLELLEEVYEKSCKILGEEDPDTLLVQTTLLKLREKK